MSEQKPWKCPRCGSGKWIGWAQAPWAPRMAQCVPCGHVHGPAPDRAPGSTR